MHHKEMEDAFFACIIDMCVQNLCMSHKKIESKSKNLVGGTNGFKASRGWLQHFMKRKGYSLRHKVTMGTLSLLPFTCYAGSK